MINLYYIRNVGCDDETCGLAKISDENFTEFKRMIEDLNKNSTYGCMPKIEVYKINESAIRTATEEDIEEHNWRILYLGDERYVLKDEHWDAFSSFIRVV